MSAMWDPHGDKLLWQMANAIPRSLVLQAAKYVIPDEGYKWVMHTINESWKQFKCHVKTKYYKKYETDEERLERRPETVPLEDFKMLLRYWGDEAVQSLADDNVAHRNTITETHTMGPRTHAQAKEKLKKLDPNIVEPVDAEIYLETYKRKPGRKYKTDVEEHKTKYMKIKALVDSGNIVEANAMVSGGKKHGRTWLVGRQGQKSVETSTLAGKDNYVQEMTLKIRQELEADLEAKVNLKVKENMSWLMQKLGEANPGLKLDVGDFCATLSSDQDDNGTPMTTGGTDV
ncbi:uncharacterized protein LOC141718948 [Apium graveolens]|uniref:uncharacterized protein LOC141718948 n=1 Tax=Apium graveolens TaxID=4045 RepID=UPI003D7B44D5